MTNPRYLSNHLSTQDAIQEIKSFLNEFELLNTDYIGMEVLLLLLDKYQITKQEVHDTNIVATMLENNISQIISFNEKHFKIFQELTVIVP